jgi:hypothetical protein
MQIVFDGPNAASRAAFAFFAIEGLQPLKCLSSRIVLQYDLTAGRRRPAGL